MSSEVNMNDYIKFAEAAAALGVRFQQVYNRAVDKKKMRWIEIGKSKYVHIEDVAAWQAVRTEYFSK